MFSRFPWGVTKCPLNGKENLGVNESLERDASGAEYNVEGGVAVGCGGVGGDVGVGFLGGEYSVGGRVGVGFLGTEYIVGGDLGAGILGAEYSAGGRVGVGFLGTEYIVGGNVGVGILGAEYSVGGRVGGGRIGAEKMSLDDVVSRAGPSTHRFAHPSKQHRPKLGQSVSSCPGDQQLDTAPAHSASDKGLREGHCPAAPLPFSLLPAELNAPKGTVLLEDDTFTIDKVAACPVFLWFGSLLRPFLTTIRLPAGLSFFL